LTRHRTQSAPAIPDSFNSMVVTKDDSGTVSRTLQSRPLSDLPGGEGDVLIRVDFSSLNYKDAMAASGHPGVAGKFPLAPGIDAAGVVAESHAPVFQPGDEVIVTGFDLGTYFDGGFGRFIRVPYEWIVRCPLELDLYRSMCIGTAGLTAMLSINELERNGVSPRSGEVLVRVERKLELHVPAQLMLKINGIADAGAIQAGQTLKMIRGPFHAVISKSRFVMDVFLEEPKTGRRIFVRRFPVGVGKDGSTPIGRWRIALGGKMTHAPWTPPASSNLTGKKIQWGQPDYPLGAKGYWISLEGIENDGNPHTREDGYGIHGTNDQDSIGKASSLGCIRLADDDIEMLFAILYEKWSTVTILP